MKSRNTFSRSANDAGRPRFFGASALRKSGAGFTLMEVIVVIGIMTLVLAAGLAYSFDAYRGYLFRSEYKNVQHIIAQARNRAVNNFYESQHGVEFLADKYVLFIGNTYDEDDDRNEEFPKSQAFSIIGVDAIVFEQLSGAVDTAASSCDDSPCAITFDGGGVRVQTITINDAGGIIW